MSKLSEYIKSKRSTLSDSSIKTYSSILRSLYRKLFDTVNDDDMDMKKFNQVDKIMKSLESLESNKRKTILSALVIITDNDKYRELMLEDVKKYNETIKTQEPTESQKENWIDSDGIKSKYHELQQIADAVYKKKNLKQSDLQDIQNYIILSVLSGIYIPPRRSKDYVDFKIKNIDKQKDNYMVGNKFVFNSYKTAKTYGKQEVKIPPKLRMIINKWMLVNPTDYLLFDSNLNKISNVKMTQRLNRIFGKKFSVNGLRHTTLTEKYAENFKQMKELEQTMKEMGSSKAMAETYIKNID
jgi:hypothetical protein